MIGLLTVTIEIINTENENILWYIGRSWTGMLTSMSRNSNKKKLPTPCRGEPASAKLTWEPNIRFSKWKSITLKLKSIKN